MIILPRTYATVPTFLDVCLSVVFNPHSLGTDEFQEIGNKGSNEACG